MNLINTYIGLIFFRKKARIRKLKKEQKLFLEQQSSLSTSQDDSDGGSPNTRKSKRNKNSEANPDSTFALLKDVKSKLSPTKVNLLQGLGTLLIEYNL